MWKFICHCERERGKFRLKHVLRIDVHTLSQTEVLVGGSVREGKYLIKTTTTAEVQAVTAALRGTHEGSPPHNNKTAPHPPPPDGQRDTN